MFRWGLMHGEIRPLNIAGEEGGEEDTNTSYGYDVSITRKRGWLSTDR